jgi:hypothetical protein
MLNTLNLEDRLEGETNFWAWKARVLLIFEENDLKEYVEDVVPSSNDTVDLEFHKKKEVKAKHAFLDSMKENLIPYISNKENTKDMYDSVVGLYQNNNNYRMLHLKHQLHIVNMTNEDTIVSYLMNTTHIQEQLTTIGETI